MLRGSDCQNRINLGNIGKIGKIAGRTDRGGERGRGQIGRVGVGGIDLVHYASFQRPDQHIAPVAAEHLRQSCAPCACTDYANSGAFA